jgi:hypothetical protein
LFVKPISRHEIELNQTAVELTIGKVRFCFHIKGPEHGIQATILSRAPLGK